VVVIHYARPYTTQKASGGCVRAISGSASKFAEDNKKENKTQYKKNSEEVLKRKSRKGKDQ
jgi:hypothetical protein